MTTKYDATIRLCSTETDEIVEVLYSNTGGLCDTREEAEFGEALCELGAYLTGFQLVGYNIFTVEVSEEEEDN